MSAGAATPQIILASASPRRLELLKQIAVRAIVLAVDVDETRKAGEPVPDFVRRLAIEKARRGFDQCETTSGENQQKLPVLGADTIIEIGDIVLGKPENRQHAKQMLQKLSAKSHTVHTSVAIVTEDKTVADICSTRVTFKQLAESEIDRYLATGEADDKAGSYAIQGIAAQFITNINGSYSGVMGLPLYETAELLRQCNVPLLNAEKQ